MSAAEISGMDLGRLKVRLRSQLAIRHRADVKRARKAIERLTDQARRQITAATTEGQLYDALQAYTAALAGERGTSIADKRS